MTDRQDTIAKFLCERVGRATLRPETSLIESGLLDSLMVLEVVAFLEATFPVTLEAEDITLDNFETLAAIEALVESRVG
jgi:acyl carrier protein